MQRMKLHTSGVKLSKLGSLQDRTVRKYMLKEAQAEAKKAEFQMLIALTNPDIQDPTKRSDWARTIQKSWKQCLGHIFNIDVPEETPEETALKEYYERVVSKVKPTMRKDRKTGSLSVTGLERLQF